MPISPSLVLAAKKKKKRVGRTVRLRVNGVVIATCRTKNLIIENAAANVTSDIDDGDQRLLDEMGEKRVGIGIEGMFDPLAFEVAGISNPFNDSVLEGIVFDYGDSTIAGNFKKVTYTETGNHNDAITFSAQYMSSRAVIKS